MSSCSAKHIALAKSWLDQCTTKHSICRRTAQNKLLPARFIQILQGENGDFKPRLYATSEHDQNVPYCALSHCWGGVTDIPLLKWSTISDFTLEGISFSSLPKSFQDAVTMTHALGIQYLWIDSLCIVQDSKEDWMRESAKMGDVYEYAACTIMSATASDPHGGLFQHRESTLSSTPCRIAGSPSDGLFVLPHDTTNTATLDAVLRQSPIQSRAWCFQESYLSPRKLYFGPSGIYWTCFMGEANELNPLGRTRTPVRPDTITTLFGPAPHTEPVIPRRIPPLVMPNGLVLTVERNAAPSRDRPHIPPLRPSKHERVITGNISLEHGKPPPPRSTSSIPVDISQFQPPPRRSSSSSSSNSPSHDDLADFHATWMSIVRSYSARSLTKPSDRLVAVAGIASRLRRATGFAYAAGLWRETLLLDLMWVAAPRGAVEDMEALVERAAAPATGGSYVAPTWSWAGLGVEGLGVRKAIAQPELATVGLVEVKGVEVQTGREDGDGTGMVEGAVLWLEGKLKEIGVPGGLEIRFERTATKRTGDLEKGGERMGYIDFDVKPPEGLALVGI
ncbi:hypothetical protein NEMBOFW57_004111 [Staphylotrichum longicolle]|uniref:Heterokaryon incompatibility domain-containing protein n=1 Tax=Staphylotrichum longicolle TaxID=669026 RepID=A0AAD4I053_9PEZI|nr:hypothetical protein NEMBOFW57_004111 [Staphylotrichum longicolle]